MPEDKCEPPVLIHQVNVGRVIDRIGVRIDGDEGPLDAKTIPKFRHRNCHDLKGKRTDVWAEAVAEIDQRRRPTDLASVIGQL